MPRDILDIAASLKSLYQEVYSDNENDLSEMKMHKLLYFAQKKHYENFGEWLFDDDFEGWVHGPVNRKVRNVFSYLDNNQTEITDKEEYTLLEVIYDYGKYPPGYLRNLSHEDTAYKISREGLEDDQAGNVIILKKNIILDITPCEELVDSEV